MLHDGDDGYAQCRGKRKVNTMRTEGQGNGWQMDGNGGGDGDDVIPDEEALEVFCFVFLV